MHPNARMHPEYRGGNLTARSMVVVTITTVLNKSAPLPFCTLLLQENWHRQSRVHRHVPFPPKWLAIAH